MFQLCPIETPSNRVVEITAGDSEATLPYILSNPRLAIEKGGEVPIGTGPFRFVRYARDQSLEVARKNIAPAYLGPTLMSMRWDRIGKK